MITVSIQDIRFDFPRVKLALDRGEELMMTYHNKPLARIVPIGGKPSLEADPALSFGESAEALEPMGNEEIDRLIYG